MAFVPAATEGGSRAGRESGPVAYSWIVFALSFGLLISDYMARQVLNAVFPLLKAEWALSDGQLGTLSGVVALMVGLLTFPLSLLADRWGRIRSLTLMAVLWSIATLLCGLARSYEEMLVGRILVGVGEAAYGSVGIAVVLSVFPVRMRATLASAFIAGGLAGQVLGVGIGGSGSTHLAATPPLQPQCARRSAASSPTAASSAPMSQAGCNTMSPARCRPGYRAISDAITTCRSPARPASQRSS
jgi:MFS family permease